MLPDTDPSKYDRVIFISRPITGLDYLNSDRMGLLNISFKHLAVAGSLLPGRPGRDGAGITIPHKKHVDPIETLPLRKSDSVGWATLGVGSYFGSNMARFAFYLPWNNTNSDFQPMFFWHENCIISNRRHTGGKNDC